MATLPLSSQVLPRLQSPEPPDGLLALSDALPALSRSPLEGLSYLSALG